MSSTFWLKAFEMILALGLLVVVHEFGHYSFSRLFGVWVEKFYLFFNPWFTIAKWKPRAKTDADGNEVKTSWRATEYGVGWLPLGGYCKIAGMIDESMDTEQMRQPAKPYEFRAKPAWQRLFIMVGGVLFNFLMAIAIYTGIVYTYGEMFINYTDATEGMIYCDSAHQIGFQDGDIPLAVDGKALTYYRQPFMDIRLPVVVAQTQPRMGAEAAGILPGDRMLKVAADTTPGYDQFTAALLKHKGTVVPMVVQRADSLLTINARIDEDGKLGILLTQPTKVYNVVVKHYNIFQSVPRGIQMGWDKLVAYVKQLKVIFTPEGAKSLGGFGAIGSIFPDTWNWLDFWSITAFLSVILAVMNILPIPALDGGHVLFLLWEIITGRQPSDKFLEHAQMVGMALLLALLLFANGNDIYRYFFK